MYETGSATGVIDLITKLEAFLAANGWTTDSFATEGSGKRYHAHNGSNFLNMRAYNNETPSASIYGSNSGVYGIAMNLSTAGTGGSGWYDKTGAPAGTGGLYMTAGIVGLSAAIPTYHFFVNGASVVIVVEYTSGYFQHLAFGTLNKFGTYTGGAYFTGSRTGVDNLIQLSNGFIPGVGFFSKAPQSGQTIAPAFVSVNVDAETGWHWNNTFNGARDNTKRYIQDNYQRFETTLGIQPNTLNGLNVMSPIVVSVERGASSHGNERLSPIGEMPNVYLLKISTLTPGQQITLGSDDYRVFPFYHKLIGGTAEPSSLGTGHSSYYGFAVKE